MTLSRHSLRAIAGAFALLVAASACQPGSFPGSTATTAPLSCPSGVGAAAADAATAARCLYQAWTAGDRDKAAVFASLDVVATLSSRPRPLSAASFEGCSRGAETGSQVCRLAAAGTIYRFDVRPSEGGWRVTQVPGP